MQIDSKVSQSTRIPIAINTPQRECSTLSRAPDTPIHTLLRGYEVSVVEQ